jgi:hypothetical protein
MPRLWTELPHRELLDRPLASLGLRLDGTRLGQRVAHVHRELARAGLDFRPHVWLSTDWFTPDGVPGFAVPFYLAHPRLVRLERRVMLEVEGGSHEGCLRLLRHEAAHALDNAYRLRRRKRFREVFGAVSQPYRATYVPRPTSRSHVLNLDSWYAQSHPLEDFAESFAVWLQPRSDWRTRYAGWPALRKLEYVDELARELSGRRPLVRSRARPDSLPRIRLTLREYYREKRRSYRHDYRSDFDVLLRRVFSDARLPGRRESAAAFLLRHRAELRLHVARVTGQHAYVIDQVLNELVLRSRALGLRLVRSQRDTRIEATALLTTLTMRFVRGGWSEYQR